jgi:hypothetical protein
MLLHLETDWKSEIRAWFMTSWPIRDIVTIIEKLKELKEAKQKYPS